MPLTFSRSHVSLFVQDNNMKEDIWHKWGKIFWSDLKSRYSCTDFAPKALEEYGQNTFTLRLWTFVNEKFYLIPNRNDASKYLVMTREPNKNLTAKNKYFWNIVGNGIADSANGTIKLDFDLLSKAIYVNIHPESSAFSVNLPEPDFGEPVAA